MINTSDIERFQHFLEKHEIIPNEKIGQHFLIDPEALELIADRTLPGAAVIEIGSGIGNLTALLARRAQAVLGLEIDRQFEPILADVVKANPNVTIKFTDALKVDYADMVDEGPDDDWQIVANPPYHISEPLMNKVAGSPISSAVLLVGDKLAAAMTAEPMAMPLVMALVVLPTASRSASVWRAAGSSCAISPMPLALSAMGPKESMATLLPVRVSMPMPVMATP